MDLGDFGCRKRMESGVFPWVDANESMNSAGDHGSLWQGLPSSWWMWPQKYLEITRFRYLLSPGFGACGPRGFYGGSLLGHPRGDWNHTSYLHSAGKNPAENCCLFTCLMFILVVKSYVSLHRLIIYIHIYFFSSFFPFHIIPNPGIPFQNIPGWLAMWRS